MSQIEWEFADEKIGIEHISKVEQVLGIKFPQDYAECAMLNHGGHPSLDMFDFEGHKEKMFNYLLSYDPESSNYILDVHKDIKDRLVAGVYPFADDPFGNHICFDYRNGKEPSIVFWDHEIAFEAPEKAIFPICDTFSELLSKLYTD